MPNSANARYYPPNDTNLTINEIKVEILNIQEKIVVAITINAQIVFQSSSAFAREYVNDAVVNASNTIIQKCAANVIFHSFGVYRGSIGRNV